MPDVLEGIVHQADIGPNSPAVKDEDQDLTYAELVEAVGRCATGLADAGVVEGDRVALHLPNSVDFVVAALASLWIGAIFVPLAMTDPEVRLTTMIADCDPSVVVTTDAHLSEEPSPPWVGGVPLVPVSALSDAASENRPWIGTGP